MWKNRPSGKQLLWRRLPLRLERTLRSPSRLLPRRKRNPRRRSPTPRKKPPRRSWRGLLLRRTPPTEGAQEKEVPEDREEQLKKAQEESPAPVAAEEPAFQRVVDGKVQKGPAVLEEAQQVSHQEEAPLSPVREPEDPESRAILQAARQAAGVLKEGQNGGPVYQGELREGKPWGRGRSQQPNGLTTYEGEFRDGKREGFGVSYYKDGNPCYAGSWKEGLKEGLGVSFRDSDHALHISQWKQGTPEAFVSLFDKEGNLRYGGRIEEGQSRGPGSPTAAATARSLWANGGTASPQGWALLSTGKATCSITAAGRMASGRATAQSSTPPAPSSLTASGKMANISTAILYQKKSPEDLEEGAAASGGDLPGWGRPN